ncbi:hypothetical protein VTH06DRAFT_5813 [Thermothelomyces fergusii]
METRTPEAATPLLRSDSEPLVAQIQRSPDRSRILSGKSSADSSPRIGPNLSAESSKPGSLGRPRTVLPKLSPKLSPRGEIDGTRADEPGRWAAASDVEAYWPLDSLPASCPNARIFTWGYRTPINTQRTPVPQGDVFARAQELLIERASPRTAVGATAHPVSFIGDSRETPETIYGLYNDICRFGLAQDQAYRSLDKTLAAISTTEEDRVPHSSGLPPRPTIKQEVPTLNFEGNSVPIRARRTFIFVEVPNDPCPSYCTARPPVSHIAHNSEFSMCLASGYHPAITEGATQDMVEHTLEGIPGDLDGLYEWTLSTLDDRERPNQMVEIAEAWMAWPFRPSYSELVSRTLEDMETPDEEDGKFAMSE